LRASAICLCELPSSSLRAIFEENFLKLCFKKFSSKIASQTSIVLFIVVFAKEWSVAERLSRSSVVSVVFVSLRKDSLCSSLRASAEASQSRLTMSNYLLITSTYRLKKSNFVQPVFFCHRKNS